MEQQRDCGLLMKQIHDEMRKNANNALRPQGITLVQLDALTKLDQAPEGQRSLKELEQILHVAQSTAAGIVARLEQKGLVEGFGDAGDRRVKRVKITPAGGRVCPQRLTPPSRGGGKALLWPDGDGAGHLLYPIEKGAGLPVGARGIRLRAAVSRPYKTPK